MATGEDHPPSVLLVEDDVGTARALTKALEATGYQVTAAETGAQAMAVLETMQPDVILLDLTLPDTDGLVLATTIKALTSAPIIICSGRQEQVDRMLGLKVGADDFIAKPIDLDDLEARMEAVMRRPRGTS